MERENSRALFIYTESDNNKKKKTKHNKKKTEDME